MRGRDRHLPLHTRHTATVNRKLNPIAQIIGVRNEIEPPHIVAILEKILMPVIGTRSPWLAKRK